MRRLISSVFLWSGRIASRRGTTSRGSLMKISNQPAASLRSGRPPIGEKNLPFSIASKILYTGMVSSLSVTGVFYYSPAVRRPLALAHICIFSLFSHSYTKYSYLGKRLKIKYLFSYTCFPQYKSEKEIEEK